MNQQYDQLAPNCGIAGSIRDWAQPLPKFPAPTPLKPSMGSKQSKVADIFEMDIIDEAEALKACKVIIGQHAKKRPTEGETGKEDSIKIIK